MTQGPIQVNSEIGRLKQYYSNDLVKKLENLVPDHLSGLLFDDIPYLKVAQEDTTNLHKHFVMKVWKLFI